jgi:hypothetical protein
VCDKPDETSAEGILQALFNMSFAFWIEGWLDFLGAAWYFLGCKIKLDLIFSGLVEKFRHSMEACPETP